jgi:hypothetical protein
VAEHFKILGQLAGTGSEVTIYTVPSPDKTTLTTGMVKSTISPVQTLVTSIIVCNTHASASKTFLIRLKEDVDDGDAAKELIFSDTPIATGNTLIISPGLTLPGEASLKVKGADVSFTIVGVEVS